MNPLKKNRLVIFLLLTAMAMTTGTQKQVYGQEQKASGTAQEKEIHRVKIGPHPNTHAFFWIFRAPSNTE